MPSSPTPRDLEAEAGDPAIRDDGARQREPTEAGQERVGQDQTDRASTGPTRPGPTRAAPRFGLKSLMIATVLCSLQFSLMNYLGPVPGLVVGLVACGVLFTLLLTIGVVIYAVSPGSARRLDGLAIQLTLAILALLVVSAFTGVGQLAYRAWREHRLARQLALDLGIEFEVRTFVADNRGVRRLMLTRIDGGSIFAEAGFQPYDILLSDLPPREFLQMLEDNRGSEVQLNVAQGPTVQNLDRLPTRTIVVDLPNH